MEKSPLLKLLGKHIKKLREHKGWSQADLARAAFKDPQSIERIENGKVNPSVYYLIEIAKALNTHPKNLLNFEIQK